MWLEMSLFLLIVIILLILWIYYSGGGTLRILKLKKDIKSLQEEVEKLRETNDILRSGLGSSEDQNKRSVEMVSSLICKLERLKDALRGSKTAKEALIEEFGNGPSPILVDNILASEPDISKTLKKRLAHKVLVGDSGKDILNELEDGKTIENAVAESGLPLNIGRRRIVMLQRLGYLDNKLNLTEVGFEAIS